MYARLNHINICTSYSATLQLISEISKLNVAPLKKWRDEGIVFKFWGDNVDKQQKVRDIRSDHQGSMLHMYSILIGRSRTQNSLLPYSGQVSSFADVSAEFFLPTADDVNDLKANLVILVSRALTDYFPQLASFRKVIEKHIQHRYSREMSQKSEVYVLDVLMKNEAKHKDMIDIMTTLQEYLGDDDDERRVLSGGDQLTVERQVGAQRHLMCGNTVKERLEILEPVSEDWHFRLCLIAVSGYSKDMHPIHFNTYTHIVYTQLFLCYVGYLEDTIWILFW